MGAAQLGCGDTGAAWFWATEHKGGEAPVRERKSACLNGAAVINTTKREADTVGEIAQDGAFVE